MKACDFPALARNRITIQKRTDTVDSYGAATIAWSDVTDGDAWAVIEPLNVYERPAQGALSSRASVKMTIRWLEGLKDTALTGLYRVTFDSRTFPIIGIRNLSADLKTEGRNFQELMCVENDAENTG